MLAGGLLHRLEQVCRDDRWGRSESLFSILAGLRVNFLHKILSHCSFDTSIPGTPYSANMNTPIHGHREHHVEGSKAVS